MKPLRVGIIGLGVGEQHIEGVRRGGGEVALLCDFSTEKLHEVSARHPGIPITGSADAVLDDPSIDVVSIASWDDHHFAQVMRALETGKHVFVEKPLCMSKEEARGIRAALAARPGLRLSSNLILRRSRRFLEVKRMIDAGRLGEMYHMEADYNYGRVEKITQGWRGRIDYYSVVYGGGVHMIDLLRWFSGSEPVEVSAYGNRIATRGTGFRFDDCVVAILKFANGATGKVASNYGCVHPHFHQISLYGTKATFQNTRAGGELITERRADAKAEAVNEPYPGVQKGELLAEFLDCLRNGREPEVSADSVFRTMSVCFAIEDSARLGKPMAVEYL